MSEAAPSASVWKLTWRFLGLGRPYTLRIVLTITVCFFASGAKAMQAFILKPVIEKAKEIADKPKEAVAATDGGTFWERARDVKRWDLQIIAWAAILTSAFMFVFGWLKDFLTNWLTNRIVADLRNKVAEHLPFLPLRYHYDRKSGDLVSRVTNDVALTENVSNFYFDDMIVQPIMILCALVLIVMTNWTLAVIAVVFFALYALLLGRVGRAMRKSRKRSLESLGDMTGTMLQTFGGIKVVKAFSMEAAQAAQFREHNDSFFRNYMKVIRRKALGENLSQLLAGLMVAGFLVGGFQLLSKGVMTAGDMAVLGMAVAIINSSVKETSKSYNRLVDSSAGCERVFELLDQPRETEHDQGSELPAVGAGVEYRGVSFGYDAVPVLRDVSFTAAPGEVIAIVGRTGAGKTTLLDLLCRFYDPTQGSVIVNGVDLRGVKRSSLLSHIAVVTQDPFLFNTTLGENIRHGRPGASASEVEAAAKAAYIHDFIAGLPKGYETPAGERGTKLSGGQRQRVTLARAILRNPAILILDEATSSLDAESEKAVQLALGNLIRAKGRITFVIAHRLSTVKNADRILVIDEGRISEQGSHDELIARAGVYATLYATQFQA
ncbi:MAG TPA: ABC transporter ATP-binding protein [Planctomycetota bacterium]